LVGSIFLLVVVAASAPTMHIDGACGEALERALRRVRPGERIHQQGEPSQPGDLRVRLTAASGGFSLEIRGADGELRLERALTVGECALAAEAAAEVVERFLVSIDWHAPEASLEPLPSTRAPATPEVPAPAPAPSSASSRSASPPADPATGISAGAAEKGVAASPRGPFWTRPEVSLGPSIGLGIGRGISGVSLEVAVRTAGWLRTSLWLGASAPENQSVSLAPNDVVRLQLDYAFVSAAPCLTWTHWELCGGGAAGASGAYGQVPRSSPGLYQTTSGVIAAPAIAATGRLAYQWSSGFGLSLQALAGVPLARPSFSIQNLENEPGPIQYALPAADLVAAVHAEWTFR
jgi:hypothetical protein